MTYEEFFKNGDKFLYESHAFSDYIIYDVEIVDMRVGYHSMEVKFKRMGDSTLSIISSPFSQLFL